MASKESRAEHPNVEAAVAKDGKPNKLAVAALKTKQRKEKQNEKLKKLVEQIEAQTVSLKKTNGEIKKRKRGTETNGVAVKEDKKKWEPFRLYLTNKKWLEFVDMMNDDGNQIQAMGVLEAAVSVGKQSLTVIQLTQNMFRPDQWSMKCLELQNAIRGLGCSEEEVKGVRSVWSVPKCVVKDGEFEKLIFDKEPPFKLTITHVSEMNKDGMQSVYISGAKLEKPVKRVKKEKVVPAPMDEPEPVQEDHEEVIDPLNIDYRYDFYEWGK